METNDRPPRAGVIGTVVVVVLMALSTAASTELWPFGPWELFSRTRQPVQRSVIAKSVVDGEERQINFGALPMHYGGAHQLLGGFMRLPPAEQDAVCAAWTQALSDAGRPPDVIRIYRLERSLRLDGRPQHETKNYCMSAGWMSRREGGATLRVVVRGGNDMPAGNGALDRRDILHLGIGLLVLGRRGLRPAPPPEFKRPRSAA